MEDVMNNKDLRRIIWSYLRDKYYNKCMKCDKVCSWNKNRQELEYVKWTGFVNCYKCFREGFLGKNRIFIVNRYINNGRSNE